MVHQPELLLVNVLYVLIHAGDESGISLAGADPAGFFFELVEAIQSILHQHLGIKELTTLRLWNWSWLCLQAAVHIGTIKQVPVYFVSDSFDCLGPVLSIGILPGLIISFPDELFSGYIIDIENDVLPTLNIASKLVRIQILPLHKPQFVSQN